jgi:N-methylhydantoinase A
VTPYRIGVDIGGTFTDFTLFDDRSRLVRTHKCLTTPADPSEAVIEGCGRLLSEAGVGFPEIATIVHGTTLVTNAVIERKGSPTAMLVTRGCRDLLDIAQERRYDLFDLTIRFPEPVVPRALRFEVGGRLRSDGSEVEPLRLDGIEAFIEDAAARHGIEAVAVCFLHSYVDAHHEEAVVGFLARRFPALSISSSAAVFPYMREYARWTTTCLNAYVQPVVDRYLVRLEDGLRGAGFPGRLFIMSSSGGTLTPAIARRFPVRLLESGPAAGALMSARHGRDLGVDQILSFDMGGTTAKGCIIRDGRPLKRYELEVARVHEFKRGSGLPVKIPVLDMIEIGAGGGSLAAIDERGLIRVGPRSAGADPGPACYGRGGTEPTLTDANLLLGYLGAGSFLGGAMALDTGAARAAVARVLGEPLGMSAERAAWGVHEVISEDIARAFRVHASEQGVDYRRCTMLVFGGSGPLHGTQVARKLRIPRVVCPIGAGVMSAFGLLASPLAFEIVRSRRIALKTLSPDEIGTELRRLDREATAMLIEAGLVEEDLTARHHVDMRYEGQGYELEVAVAGPDGQEGHSLGRAFEDAYREVFGLSFAGRPIEIVNWKAEVDGPVTGGEGPYRLHVDEAPRQALKGERSAWDPKRGTLLPMPVYDRYALPPGTVVEGPALIEEREATCVLSRGDRLTVDRGLNLVIDIGIAL